jgi:hypothetical protein
MLVRRQERCESSWAANGPQVTGRAHEARREAAFDEKRLMSKTLADLRQLLTSRPLLLAVAATWVGVSLIASVKTSRWHWFQRSGAVVVSTGALLSARRLIRLGVAGLYQAETEIDGGGAAPTEVEVEAMHQWRLDLSAMRTGAALLAVGTAIWAYGDLLGDLW